MFGLRHLSLRSPSVFTVWHAYCCVYTPDTQYTKTVSSPERTKTMIPLIILLAAAHKHAADRAVDVQRQQYALQVAEFNIKYHTQLDATKKNVIVYDAKTGTVSNQNVNDVYHGAGHKSVSQYHSAQPAAPSKVQQ